MLLLVPEAEFLALRPKIEFVNLPSHLCIHEPHQKVEFLYFPNEGVISLVVELKDGKTVEAGLALSSEARRRGSVGNSGAKPEAAARGGANRGRRIPDTGATNESAAYRCCRIWKLLCNGMPQGWQCVARLPRRIRVRVHNIEHRLARWLLMAQDRVTSETLPITHDFLATMLGTDRPSVSLAAGVLQGGNK